MWGTPDISNTQLFAIIGTILSIPLAIGIFIGWVIWG